MDKNAIRRALLTFSITLTTFIVVYIYIGYWYRGLALSNLILVPVVILTWTVYFIVANGTYHRSRNG